MNELKLETLINKANEEIEKISNDELEKFYNDNVWFCLEEFKNAGLKANNFKTLEESAIQAAKITKRLFIIIDLLKEDKKHE